MSGLVSFFVKGFWMLAGLALALIVLYLLLGFISSAMGGNFIGRAARKIDNLAGGSAVTS